MEAGTRFSRVEEERGEGRVGEGINGLAVGLLGERVAACAEFVAPIAVPGMAGGDRVEQPVFHAVFLGHVHYANLSTQRFTNGLVGIGKKALRISKNRPKRKSKEDQT